jgi:hypothetical protein
MLVRTTTTDQSETTQNISNGNNGNKCIPPMAATPLAVLPVPSAAVCAAAAATAVRSATEGECQFSSADEAEGGRF